MTSIALIVAGLITVQSQDWSAFVGKWEEPHGDTVEVFADGTFQLVDGEYFLDPGGSRRLKYGRKITGDLKKLSGDRLRLTGPSQILLAKFQLKKGTLFLDIDGWGKRFFARAETPVLFGPTVTLELSTSARVSAEELQRVDAIMKRRLEACVGSTYRFLRNGQRLTVSIPNGFDLDLVQLSLTTAGNYSIAEARDVASERNPYRQHRILPKESSPWVQQFDFLIRVRDEIASGPRRASIITGWPVVAEALTSEVGYDSPAGRYTVSLSSEFTKAAKQALDQHVNSDQLFALCLDGMPILFFDSRSASWVGLNLLIKQKLSDDRAFFMNMLRRVGNTSPRTIIVRQSASFSDPK